MPRKPSPEFGFDIVIAGDMAGGVENCLRIAGEAMTAAQAGYKVALLHVPSESEALTPISAEVRVCLRNSSVSPLDLEREATARLLLVHPPFDARAMDRVQAAVTAKRVVLVPGVSQDLDGLDAAAAMFIKPTVAATSAAMRERLRAHPQLRLEPRDWMPIAVTEAEVKLPRKRELVVGAVIPPHWPKAVDAIKHVVGAGDDIQVYVWRDRGPRRELPSVPGHWRTLDGVEISFDWFLRRIDVLLVLEDSHAVGMSEAAIAAAQAAGKRVAATTALDRYLPAGAIAAEPEELIDAVRQACASGAEPGKGVSQRKAGSAATAFLKRLSALTGMSPHVPRVGKQVPRGQTPRVLFVPKGGVGVGHVARLLAIARRAGREYEPVFVSLADSASLIEELGFRAEFIPSAAYAGDSSAEWDPWFQYELEQLIDAYDASAVVWDGSDPPAVLSRAVASRSWCRGVWIRRGMWEPGYNPSLQRSANYDVIIEPGELAAARDQGATVARRHETIPVDPITLLDAPELLSREAAAKALGLDPRRTAMLVQLGSGENRDILTLIERIVESARGRDGLQIAVAEWANASGTLSLWPEITILKGAPLSLYYKAFDFTISAAGYNSFHEIINFGLPAILVPNRAPGMDDQAARSSFAQDAGAAIELRESEFAELPPILDLFMKPEFRAVMQQNCTSLARKNGARAASRIIADLVS